MSVPKIEGYVRDLSPARQRLGLIRCLLDHHTHLLQSVFFMWKPSSGAAAVSDQANFPVFMGRYSSRDDHSSTPSGLFHGLDRTTQPVTLQIHQD
jgi:hypothetical protein